VALLAIVGSGVAGYASGQREIERHTPDYSPVDVSALGTAYTTTHLEMPAGKVKITFANHDPAGTIHDFGVYSAPPAGSDPKTFVPGTPFVAVLPIDGGHKQSTIIDTEVVGLQVGQEYLYRCDFHPGMKGTLSVVPAPEKGASKE
jgi:plastocyanin